jgi:hypothetical protein
VDQQPVFDAHGRGDIATNEPIAHPVVNDDLIGHFEPVGGAAPLPFRFSDLEVLQR